MLLGFLWGLRFSAFFARRNQPFFLFSPFSFPRVRRSFPIELVFALERIPPQFSHNKGGGGGINRVGRFLYDAHMYLR